MWRYSSKCVMLLSLMCDVLLKCDVTSPDDVTEVR